MLVFFAILSPLIPFLFKNLFKYLPFFYLFFSILTGAISEDYKFIFEPVDWATISFFLIFSFYGLLNKRTYLTKYSWIDKIIWGYYIIVIIIPLIINIFFYNSPLSYKYFMPVRIWLVYRIFFCFFNELKIRNENTFGIKNILNILLIISSIAAILSIIRFFPTSLSTWIKETWPIYYEEEVVTIHRLGRLQGTMSGINGSGNFFCILSIISLFLYQYYKNIRYILIAGLFIICLLLTGSLSSIFAFIIILFFFHKKLLPHKNIFSYTLLSIAIYFLIAFNVQFNTSVQKRIDRTFNTSQKYQYLPDFLPYTLDSRIGYWVEFTSILVSEGRLFFGLGPGGFFNYNWASHNYLGEIGLNPNAESFYFRIVNESGILAFIYVIFFFHKIYHFSNQKTFKGRKYFYLFKMLLLVYIFAGIGNETLYYGANTEFFGLLLASIYFESKISQKHKINGHSKKGEIPNYI